MFRICMPDEELLQHSCDTQRKSRLGAALVTAAEGWQPCPQVVGRVQSGHETLSEIITFGAGPDDEPLEPVVISRCGSLHAQTLRTCQ